MGVEEVRAIASDLNVPFEASWGPGKLVLEIYEKTTESRLWGPVFVMDYPKEVSPLARDPREAAKQLARLQDELKNRTSNEAKKTPLDKMNRERLQELRT